MIYKHVYGKLNACKHPLHEFANYASNCALLFFSLWIGVQAIARRALLCASQEIKIVSVIDSEGR